MEHEYSIGIAKEIVITGDPKAEDTQAILQKIRSKYMPGAVVILNPTGVNGEEMRKLIPFIKDMKQVAGKATTYICENFACKSPSGCKKGPTERTGNKAFTFKIIS